MKPALKDAIQRIKDAGFDHIKVELEGNIGRDGEADCFDCDGEGREDCDNCCGEGYQSTGRYTRVSGEEVLEECDICVGDGRISCSTCEGSGTSCDYRSEDDCEEFMKDYVSPEVRRRLVFGRFYEDGSVDSEFTFTVHIDHIQDVLDWMAAFNALADECGEMDTRGAGLHITVIPSEAGGNYPVSEGTLNSIGARNFKEQVTKLMPALFFLASSGHQSRALQYRPPQVTEDKYGAISTHDDSCFEFRVFETCYDRPEAFYDYMQTIANCLKFYTDHTLTVQSLGKQFGFKDAGKVARLFDTPEQLRILNATVKHIKPVDKSYKKLKQERGVHYTLKGLGQELKAKEAQLKADYEVYRENWYQLHSQPLNETQQAEVDTIMIHENIPRDRAEEMVRGTGRGGLESLRDFLRRNTGQRSYSTMVTV